MARNRQIDVRIIVSIVFGIITIIVVWILAGTFILPSAAPEVAYPERDTPVFISLQKSMCLGTCPAYSVSIVSPDGDDGIVSFEGDLFTCIRGNATGSISKNGLRELIDEIKQSGFFEFKRLYIEPGAMDDPSFALTVTLGGRSRQTIRYRAAKDSPPQLDRLASDIESAAGSAQWVYGCPESLREQMGVFRGTPTAGATSTP